MVLIGGQRDDQEPCPRVYAYHTEQKLWEEWPPTPTTWCGAAVHDQSLLAIGGEQGGRDVFVLNAERTEWKKMPIPDMPTDVSFCAAATLSSKLYVCGGSLERHGSLQVFDFRREMWSELTPAPQDMCRSATILSIVPVGHFLVTDELCYYDTVEDVWRGLPNRPAGKTAAIASLGGQLVAFGHYADTDDNMDIDENGDSDDGESAACANGDENESGDDVALDGDARSDDHVSSGSTDNGVADFGDGLKAHSSIDTDSVSSSRESDPLGYLAADVLSYDFRCWMPLPTMHRKCYLSSACTVNEKVYVSGGTNEQHNSLQCFI